MVTFKKAYASRNAPYGLMFHSDRGSQYTAFAFRKFLDSINVVQSFSKKGYPFDNATLSDLKLSVFSYIEGYYNSKRPHGSLGYLTPNEKETAYWGQK